MSLTLASPNFLNRASRQTPGHFRSLPLLNKYVLWSPSQNTLAYTNAHSQSALLFDNDPDDSKGAVKVAGGYTPRLCLVPCYLAHLHMPFLSTSHSYGCKRGGSGGEGYKDSQPPLAPAELKNTTEEKDRARDGAKEMLGNTKGMENPPVFSPPPSLPTLHRMQHPPPVPQHLIPTASPPAHFSSSYSSKRFH
ncbi:unnamed protein product [Pleuronectes platessa]|uniref:Uncharacterized protein n=1 Tax=Pleuronectes platessa TaxID=8262 RepID=A0A9N7VV80_PLEPL|nr:unnamed protein product [Pleuronectes platessa]